MNQRNEPHHEKEHVKISNTAKFQSCRPNTCGMADIEKHENQAWADWDYHTFVSYFQVYIQMSAIPRLIYAN